MNSSKSQREEPSQLFVRVVDARQEIDLRIGASFTRFQTMLLKDRFSIDSTGDKERSRVISYGPCQFPTLGLIVERYWEIQAHEPEEFWTINCSHESEDGLATKAENKYVMFYNLFIDPGDMFNGRMKLENISKQLKIEPSRGESCSAKRRNPKECSTFVPMVIVRKYN
ncbi:hypothetical protein HID58_041504 [Brassica napus]|uniref:DNA topoisomerase n=1 Tax=Brassica napus TaxID=3708 RepID=A0ABQ8BCL7_BRANA|nr:hypothetical protein HID58_041504 [Brassica napus]